jgi:hypothetical protein
MFHYRHANPTTTTIMASSQPPAYMAGRVEEGAALPKVDMRSVQAGEGTWKPGTAEEERLVVRELVAGHMMEGLRGELVREVVEMMGV